MPEDSSADTDKLRQGIETLEAQQREFGLNLSQQIAELRQRLEGPGSVSLSGSGAVATTGGVATGEHGAAVGGDVGGHVIVASGGSTIVIGDQPIAMTAVRRESALGRYLSHIISRNRYLQLQGIRSGGKLVNIELEHIYITLKVTRTRTLEAEEAWLAEEQLLAPGAQQKRPHEPRTETVTVKVEEALAEHTRLVMLGDPGSGKTTLLRYLALCYARDRTEGLTVVRDRLGLPESGYLPILLPLRNLGAYLEANYPSDDGTEGRQRVLEFLRMYLHGERIDIPDDFFDASLATGHAVMLFDGMDEVGDFDLRRRVARLIEAFSSDYIEATGAKPPRDRSDGQPPKDRLHHPVVNITWYEACAYCRWLSDRTRTARVIALPSEAEWEKAARGNQDQRAYPWGDAFDVLKCNSDELGLADTTPVGVFPTGASSYGCLDMAGNVWEWTRSLWERIPQNLASPIPKLRTMGGKM